MSLSWSWEISDKNPLLIAFRMSDFSYYIIMKMFFRSLANLSFSEIITSIRAGKNEPSGHCSPSCRMI